MFGCYYVMDCDKCWECEEKVYNVICNFDVLIYVIVKEGVEVSYNEGLIDEFVVLFIVEN